MNKKRHVFSLAVSSLLTCISCIMLYLVPIIPTGKISVLCLAVAVQCVILIECGKGFSTVSGIVCSLFIMLFGANKFISVGYMCLFAFYPVLKSLFEATSSKIAEWMYKILYYALAAFIVSLVLKALNLPLSFPWYLYIGVIVILTIFDIALSFFISYYIEKIIPITSKISKRNIEFDIEKGDF